MIALGYWNPHLDKVFRQRCLSPVFRHVVSTRTDGAHQTRVTRYA
jgi:hypothetical protein